jgi:GNAT superfamily N-acetyltransferase
VNAGWEIRLAVLQDAALLPEIERSSGEAFRVVPDLAWIADDAVMSAEQHKSLIAGDGVWVAASGDRVAGFISAAATPDAWHIWQMAVAHDAQGRGIGRALLDTAIEAARDRGASAVTLTTFRDVEWNAPFYSRSGFRVLGAEELNERLRDVLANEVAHGLPAERRCAMQLAL